MKNMLNDRLGFTLIELLVVVLIIGILAAIALPQYRVAVDKADYVQLMADVNAIQKAEEAYFLANGDYTRDLDALDISLVGFQPQRNGVSHEFEVPDKRYINVKGAIWRSPDQAEGGAKSLSNIYAKSYKSGAIYFVYLDNAYKPSGSTMISVESKYKRQCVPSADNERSLRVCKALGGEACTDPYFNRDGYCLK